MPIYEYTCDACGKRSSALLARFDSPDPVCPHCGSPRVRRLVSTFATHRSDDFGSGGDWDGGGDDDFEGGGFDGEDNGDWHDGAHGAGDDDWD